MEINVRPAIFAPIGQGYQRPLPDEITRLLAWLGLSKTAAGSLLGERKLRRYTNPNPKTGQPEPIPYATWRYLLNLAGIVRDKLPGVTHE